MEKLDSKRDIDYLVEKRDFALEMFCDTIKADCPEITVDRKLQSLMKAQKRLRLAEDAIIIYRIVTSPNCTLFN